MKIGFIGLGNMGAPMAANLAAAGHEVTGFDVAGISLANGETAASAVAAATGRDVVITMLPDGAILRRVAAEIIPVMAAGCGFVDCSTVDVDSARAVAMDADAAGLLAVDAPVSGGVGGAVAGTLTFMAGGSDAAFALAEPLFAIMGQKAVHCGDSGAGQSAKICNNMILGATMIATCEAFALADRLGLDRQKMFDVVSTSSGYSWTMNTYCPAPGVGPKSPADNGFRQSPVRRPRRHLPLRPLRGRGPARDRGPRHDRGQPRRFRDDRRGNRRDGIDRRDGKAYTPRPRERRVGGGGILLSRTAGSPALYQARLMGGA